MNKLQEKGEELQAKRKALADLFAKYPEMDIPNEEAVKIKGMNDELTALGKAYDSLREMAALADENQKNYEADARPVNRLPFASGDGSKPAQDAPVGSTKSIGELLVESRAYKDYQPGAGYAKGFEAPVNPEFKTTMDTATGFAPQAIRIPKLEPFPLRRLVVADLIPGGTTTMISVVYMEETTFTNAAAATAEGATKPEGAIAFTERTAPVRKIAVTIPVTDELMADAPAMRDYVNARLGMMVQLTEEVQLLRGSGVAPQITGITNVSGIQTQALGADPIPDAVYKAMVLIQTAAFTDPTGVIFHPLDWQQVRLLRTSQGIYIWGNPSDAGPERIWGMPVIATTAQSQHTAVVADFATAMQIFRRQGLTLEVTNSHDQDFIKNLLRIRAEERLALAVYRPLAVCTVTGL